MSSTLNRYPADRPIVIGHRGASGYVPEHTLAAYWLAIEQGADYVEPDLVATRDGVLVCRHENAIAVLLPDGQIDPTRTTTDVAMRPEFAARCCTKQIDGVPVTGWFTEDFSLAELKSLRARERLPAVRPCNTRFDGMFDVPTFEEVLHLVAAANMRRASCRPVGVYPETKHPSYFRDLGLALEPPLLALLARHGYRGRDAAVFIQSFEVANLQDLARQTELPLIQLVDASGAPFDLARHGDKRSYADLLQPASLTEVARYACGIGVHTDWVLASADERGTGVTTVTPTATSLLADAHTAGLLVHAWTFRAENHFLPAGFRSTSAIAAEWGDLTGWITAFLHQGLDGLFTDHPYIGRLACDAYLRGQGVTAAA